MSKGTTKSAGTGIGLGGVVFIVFLVLKLAEIGQVANWSWWWVTAPLWIPVALILGILAIVGVVVFIAAFINRN